MSPKISTPVVLFVLSALAALVNLHAPTVFFDSQIMLGGSLAVFALLQFGWPGLLVGVVALGATAFRWGHPFELLIGTGFLVWLKIFLERFNGGWSQRDNGRVVIAAAGFWLFAGFPLEVLLFNRFFELPVAQALGIGLKESVTGLLNTTLGLLGFLAVCWWSSGRQPGTFSIRGLAFAAILTAISIPGLGLTLVLSNQLKTAVLEEQFLDLYFYGNRAADLSDLGATEALQNLARTEGQKQFLLRRADGSTISSDPALFRRLQEYYEIQIPSRTGREDLGVYRPLKNAPVISSDADSYWFATFARPSTDISGNITEVTVIETPPEIVRLLDYKLLLPSFTVLLVLLLGGTLLAAWASRAVEQQFQRVLTKPDASSMPLAHSRIRELDTLVQAVNKHEAARQQSRDELQRILEYLPIAVAATSLTSPANITYINAQFTRTFGYTLEDVPTVAAWAELAYPDPDYRREAFRDWDGAVARAIETKGRVESMEFEVTSKDGTKRDIILRAVVLEDRLLVSLTDITELKKAQSSLRSLQEELEHTAYELTENIPVGTYTMVQPPDGGLAYFSFMSTRFLELTGLTPDEARENPMNAFACVHPDDHEEWVRKNAYVFEHKLPFKEECRVVVNGVTRWIVAESTPRDLPNGSVVWEGVLQDITERKIAEQKLAANEAQHRRDLENKLKVSLTASAVAHEINQPLSTILLASKMALSHGSDLGETLKNIATEADRVVATIKKMKTLMRNVQSEHRKISLADVVESSLLYNKGILTRRRITVRTSGLDQPSEIFGDDAQIQLALTNLLRNAAEAIDEATPPRREIFIEITGHDKVVELVIGDSGPGWPDGHPIGAPLNSTKSEGSGIGLYVVRTAASNHHADITFGRSPLGGAEVRMTFPAA